MTEVIEVVIDSGNTKRSHRGDDHRAVEGADFMKRLGKHAEVVHTTKNTDRGAEHKAGKLYESADDRLVLHGHVGNGRLPSPYCSGRTFHQTDARLNKYSVLYKKVKHADFIFY